MEPSGRVREAIETVFPACLAFRTEVRYDSPTEYTLLVDLAFENPDPRLVDRKKCAELCDVLRGLVRETVAAYGEPELAGIVNIRVQLAFFQQDMIDDDKAN